MIKWINNLLHNMDKMHFWTDTKKCNDHVYFVKLWSPWLTSLENAIYRSVKIKLRWLHMYAEFV